MTSPIKPRAIYLDNAASTPVWPDLIRDLPALLESSYANPAASHAAGVAMRRQIDRDARRLLDALRIDPDAADVVWTSGGTEANNLAISGLLRYGDALSGAQAVTTVTEHPSVERTLAALARAGLTVRRVPVDAGGQVRLEALEGALSAATRLVCICLVQNETGVIQDLSAVRRVLARAAPRARLHVDAVQAVGKVEIPWRAAGIDTMSVAGHKLHAPGGTGCLILRRGTELSPILYGGGQQQNRRSGSLDACGIRALCAAARRAVTQRSAAAARAAELRTRLLRGLREQLPARDDGPGCWRRLSPPRASPFITCLAFPGCQGAVLVRLLSERGIHVGTGSACAAESSRPSAVLTAMGVDRDTAFAAMRISFGHLTQAADVDGLLAALPQVLADY